MVWRADIAENDSLNPFTPQLVTATDFENQQSYITCVSDGFSTLNCIPARYIASNYRCRINALINALTH